MSRRAAVVAASSLIGLALVAALVIALVNRSDRTDATSPTTVSDTTSPSDARVTAPLTGLVVEPGDSAALARLDRPALVAKIDNAPVAMPQIGLDAADIVIELQVEGISRYMAVVHSNEVAELGPVRSARTSDPDLLAMFGEPLFAWSGGNPKVTRLIESTPWIQSLTPDTAGPAFSRTRDRRAPHNLLLDVPVAESMADEPPSIPTALFSYRRAGEVPGGVPVEGFDLGIGFSTLGFDWDPDAQAWMRRANGAAHRDVDGEQLRAANVVVLATPYEPSGADPQSPEAQTLGSGDAWVFTDGHMIRGRWSRTDRTRPWQLRSELGVPITLTPGSTWVELPPSGSEPQVAEPAS